MRGCAMLESKPCDVIIAERTVHSRTERVGWQGWGLEYPGEVK